MSSSRDRGFSTPGRWPLAISLLSFAVLLIPALQPLLRADFTCGYDNAFHLWRSVEVEHLLRQGILFSRWAPDVAHGFGFPLFVFVSPTSAYVAALFHLVDVGWPLALNVTFALGMALGGLFTLLVARDLFGTRAGLVAAVAYVYAPFQAYEVFNRGSLWEAFAWTFPPLVLWAIQRWSVRRERRFLVVGALGLAGFVLTHQLFAFLFTPLLVGWVVLATLLVRDVKVMLRGAGMGALALGLSAFFWLPGLAERGWVQTERLLGTWVFDYQNNFLRMTHLLAPPRSVDPALINDWPPKALGLLPLLIGLLSLARWRRMCRTARWQVVLLLALTVGFSLMTLPLSLPLWDYLPLLPYVQFPWRFLGPAAFCLALLAGAAASPGSSSLALHISQSPIRTMQSVVGNLQPAALILLLILGNLGWFYPDHCDPPRDISLAGMIAWERATDTLGTTAKGEYLPAWVHRMPRNAPLQTAYEDGGLPFRLDLSTLPEGSRILSARTGALEATIELDSPASFRARYLAFYYPGWRASVDGEPAEVTPTSPEGLVSFEVPAGRHTIAVRFGETPLRLAADAISLVSLLTLVVLTLRGPKGTAVGQAQQCRDPEARSLRAVLPILVVAPLLVSLKLGVIDRFETPMRRSNMQGDILHGVDVSAQVTFDDQFRLLGRDALPQEVAGDETLEIRLYWRDGVPGGPDYRPTVALKDGQGRMWSDPDLRPPRWHRTPPPSYLWPPDGYALTAFQLRPLTGTPPGVYTVTLGVFDMATLDPYAAHDSSSGALGLEIPLGRVRVTRPRRPLSLEKVSPQYATEAALGPLQLVGYGLDREEAAPGDPFLLTLFWRAEEALLEDLTARLRLLGPGGEEVLTLDLPPAHDDFPTSQWQVGDLWRGQQQLRLPAGLESGEHRWRIQLCSTEGEDCRAEGREVGLGDLQVYAPERLWEAPPLDVETNLRLGDAVTLLGATVEPGTHGLEPGTSLTVTLAWRAEVEMDVSYRVFLHLLGPGGELVAQSDGEPADWARPTTGWLPGEVVLDERVLTVPAGAGLGEYVLQAGMYTLEGGRLRTAEGSDIALLTGITVEAR